MIGDDVLELRAGVVAALQRFAADPGLRHVSIPIRPAGSTAWERPFEPIDPVSPYPVITLDRPAIPDVADPSDRLIAATAAWGVLLDSAYRQLADLRAIEARDQVRRQGPPTIRERINRLAEWWAGQFSDADRVG